MTPSALVVTLTVDQLRELVREETERAVRRAAPLTMTVEQAASYTGRAPKTVRGWIAAGLPCTREGRRISINRDELDAWRARGEPETDAVVASLRRTG